ncbi:MAG: hypothetical protein VB954_00040 [Thalassolituus sp.]|uniref:hypothetical protein n=1 Tax=Thalassolituus sp. TaxID=2030822 RepID=UPI003981C0FF
MKKLLLHIGYHKTGTTSIQNSLFDREGGHAYIGKSTLWRNSSKDLSEYLLHLICDASDDVFFKKYDELKSRLASYCGEKNQLVWSEELILGDSESYMGGSQSLETRLSRLGLIFIEFDIIVLLTVRSPIDAMYSLYSQKFRFLRNRERDFISFFKKKNILKLYNYSSLIDVVLANLNCDVVVIDMKEALKINGIRDKISEFDFIPIDVELTHDNRSSFDVDGNKIQKRFSLAALLKKLIKGRFFLYLNAVRMKFSVINEVWLKLNEKLGGSVAIPEITQDEVRLLECELSKDMECFYEKYDIDYRFKG